MTVTLETLRADFEVEIDKALFEVLAGNRWNAAALDRLTKALEIIRRTPQVVTNASAMISLRLMVELPDGFEISARILAIAEKDGLNAAMLCKLSDGAIDPRKAGGE